MADVKAGQRWRKSKHEVITVDSVDGNTVTGTLTDEKNTTVAVWAGSPGDFDDFELEQDA